MPKRIYLVPVDEPSVDLVGALESSLPGIFGIPVAPLRPVIDARAALDEARGQCNSTVLLEQLLRCVPSNDSKVLGVTDADLFIPVLTFVFGEAQLSGNAAIVSTHRLRNSFYGLADDPELFLRRLEKECAHELGHTFSLTHCGDYRCVMWSSSSVEEVDLKGLHFCGACRALLEVQSKRD